MMQNILPMINGVNASQLHLPASSHYTTVFDFLCQYFPHINQWQWRQRFLQGMIYVKENNKFKTILIDDSFAIYANKIIYYYRFLPQEIVVPFAHRILFENEYFMVVDKPHFLTVSPSGNYVQETLLTKLKKATGNNELSPIHRLDRQTAGLILFCKTKHHRRDYQLLFQTGAINKIYHAIAPFKKNLNFPITLTLHLRRSSPFYTMEVAKGIANSQTQIDILLIDKNKQWAKYQLIPTTGKLHQLRVHLNHLGIAIKNDNFYPNIYHRSCDDFSQPLQLLAKQLSFIDPITNEDHCFISSQELYFH